MTQNKRVETIPPEKLGFIIFAVSSSFHETAEKEMSFALESTTWSDLEKYLPKKEHYGQGMIVSMFTKIQLWYFK